jgi:hypothetical protein
MKYNSMPINAAPGTKVMFRQSNRDQVRWGGNDDPALVCYTGGIYTVDHTEIHSQHTKVYLKEFPGKKFNSVSFSLS